MGITVDEQKNVKFDPSRESLVNTSTASNPTSIRIGDSKLLVYSVFKRLHSRDRDRGDGNPLIYALKAKNNFKITPRECVNFLANLNIILDKILKDKQFDLIVIIPSSHPISCILARRIQRKLGMSTPLLTNIFCKKTTDEVLNELKGKTIKSKDKRDFYSFLSSLEKAGSQAEFSMKQVPPSLRHYIRPLKINDKIQINPPPKSILIVDDLLSSGFTIINAHELLSNFVIEKIEAICLLSKL